MGKVKAGATTAGRRVGALLREALGNGRPKPTETPAAFKEKATGSEKEMPEIQAGVTTAKLAGPEQKETPEARV